MTSLEDKLLGEKKEYYCSSSESEKEEDAENEQAKALEVPATPAPYVQDPDGSSNTGPKGVIKDWQRFKQLQAEEREEQEKEKLALIQRLSLTCRPSGEEDNDPEMQELLEDPYVLEYSKRRMEEMLIKASDLPQFGSVITLKSGTEFLEAVEKESKLVTIIVHIFEERDSGCQTMNEALDDLSRQHPQVKFCKILASVAGMSFQFKKYGIPALLAYKNNLLVGAYVRMTEELGTDFNASDVEIFLTENGIMNDRSAIPVLINQ